MQTHVMKLLGLEAPIFAFSHCRDVVAAVSRTGGMGVLGTTHVTPEQLDVELAWLDEHTEGKDYGVDLMIAHLLEGMFDQHGLKRHWQLFRRALLFPGAHETAL